MFNFKSEQQLIDCASTYGNKGCNGGWYEYAWKYIQRHGLVTNQTYPYQAMVEIFNYYCCILQMIHIIEYRLSLANMVLLNLKRDT